MTCLEEEIMLKLKSLVLVAVLFVAAGAMASNFRVADQVYVPIAGHAAGSSGTFISDVFISNVTADTVSVSVILSAGASGAQQNFPNVITLAPNERQEILDIFPTKLGLPSGLGQLIFNGCKQGGNCDVNTCPNGTSTGECPDFRNISVESRIYQIAPGANQATAPTTGQLFAGIPWYNFVSSDSSGVGLDKVFITGLRNTSAYRGNVGLVNASQFSTTTLVVKLFDGKTNTQIGSNFQQTLGPLGQVQPSLGSMFSAFTGVTATNAYVTVEQTNTQPTNDAIAAGCPNGCPAFFAYASVLDNQSNESLFPDCRKAAPTRGLFVYHLSTACPEAVGSNGFTWRCRSTRALAARRSCSSTSASSERASNIMYRSARQPAGTRTSHSGGKMRTSASIAASSARDWSDSPSVPTD